MGKRKQETLEEALKRPWCYYCERDFDDERVLVDHQKAKHYQCIMNHCGRRLNTVGGLKVHLQQVHKEELHEVPNAMEGKRGIDMEIFGMVGIPQELIDQRKEMVRETVLKAEAEYRARTGNPLPGGIIPPPEKKAKKQETKEELRARVQEAKRKREAEKAAKAAGLDVAANISTPTPPLEQTPPYIPQAAPYHPLNMHGFDESLQARNAQGFEHDSRGPPIQHASQGPGWNFPGFFTDTRFATPPSLPPANLPPRPAQANPQRAGHPLPPMPNFAQNNVAPHGVSPNIPSAPNGSPPVSNNDVYAANTASIHSMWEELKKTGSAPTEPDSALKSTVGTAVDEQPLPVESAPLDPAVIEALPGSDAATVEAVQAEPADDKTGKKSKKKKSGNDVLLLSNNQTSWEELRAASARYQLHPKPSTVATQAATQGVTGVVDEAVGSEMS